MKSGFSRLTGIIMADSFMFTIERARVFQIQRNLPLTRAAIKTEIVCRLVRCRHLDEREIEKEKKE